jgi:hypothetical protein
MRRVHPREYRESEVPAISDEEQAVQEQAGCVPKILALCRFTKLEDKLFRCLFAHIHSTEEAAVIKQVYGVSLSVMTVAMRKRYQGKLRELQRAVNAKLSRVNEEIVRISSGSLFMHRKVCEQMPSADGPTDELKPYLDYLLQQTNSDSAPEQNNTQKPGKNR